MSSSLSATVLCDGPLALRLVKQFPLLFAATAFRIGETAIANGELHLTGLLMLGPHLTPENHAAVLGYAKFRTKKEGISARKGRPNAS